ncbi:MULTISPECIES: DUF6778 family protein [unclassified Yoonia]|uniref:DUF6778 family protein n=1 Tax=unclassified Yoonia TaxID=2629118 RepID=UPI002AFF200E|nr:MULTISPECIES: DUF6778 family protein [unclassified Yoonia]
MFRRIFGLVVLLGALAACAPGAMVIQGDPRPDLVRDYKLVGLNFATLPDLQVSEANSYYPQADIVWRGDPAGDRLAQIEALFTEAARRNMATDMKNADRRVVLDVTLVRFHGLSNRTQFSTGGVYNVIFDLAVRDAQTGAVIEPTRRVVANLDAWGGNANAQLEAQGITQKMRVTDFLTSVLADQLR